MEATRVVLTALQELVQELNVKFAIFAGRHHLKKVELLFGGLNLRNCEPGGKLFLKRWVLGRGWSDVIEDTLVDREIHEADSELALDFSLFFDSVFNDHAHLLNGIHFSLLSHKDPVFEHLVEIERVLTHIFQLGKSPIPHLNEAVSEDRLFNFDGFPHLFDINALFDSFFLFLSRLALFGVLLASTLLRVGSSLNLSHISHDLLLDSHGQEAIQSRETVVFKLSRVSLGWQVFNCGRLLTFRESNFDR